MITSTCAFRDDLAVAFGAADDARRPDGHPRVQRGWRVAAVRADHQPGTGRDVDERRRRPARDEDLAWPRPSPGRPRRTPPHGRARPRTRHARPSVGRPRPPRGRRVHRLGRVEPPPLVRCRSLDVGDRHQPASERRVALGHQRRRPRRRKRGGRSDARAGSARRRSRGSAAGRHRPRSRRRRSG